MKTKNHSPQTKKTEIQECNEWNKKMKEIGQYPLLKMIVISNCLICGGEVNVRGFRKHLENKHFDKFYELAINLK